MAEATNTQKKLTPAEELELLKAKLAKAEEVLKLNNLEVDDPTVEARDEIVKILDKLDEKQNRAVRKFLDEKYTKKRTPRKASETAAAK